MHRLLPGSIVLFLLTLALATSPALAGTIPVTTTADSGPGSLRQALVVAGTGDTVTVPAGTYVLTTGALVVKAGVTVQGAGARATTVSGNHASEVFQATGAGVILEDLAVTGGSAASGGGISASAGLTLHYTAIVGNSASSDGGGIAVEGGQPLLIDHSLIANNQSGGTSGGLSIDSSSTSSAIVDSTIAANMAVSAGGGFYVLAGTTLLDGDTVVGNSLSGAGGQGGNFRVHEKSVTIHNTILAGGLATSGGDCYLSSGGKLVSLGHNAEDTAVNPDSECEEALVGSGDRKGLALQLGALQNNGGPTDTMLPAATSPLLDSGDGANCQTDDQRGVPRPQLGGCDIGAVEHSSASVGGMFADGLSTSGATLHASALTAGLGGSARFAYGPSTAYGAFSATVALPATTSAEGASAAVSGLQPASTYHFRLEVTTPDGVFYGSDSTFTTPPVSTPSLTAPILSAVKQSASTWREGSALARLSRRKLTPIGTVFAFALDRPAMVSLSFRRVLSGRKVGRSCVPATAKNAHKHRCAHTQVSALSVAAHAGTNHLSFAGRLDKHHRLTPGTYTLVITASAGGKHSAPATLHFKIIS
jgi:hypothetical protein